MSSAKTTAKAAAPATPLELTDEQIYNSTSNIRTALRQLRLDDMAVVAEQRKQDFGPISADIGWLMQTVDNARHYLRWILHTWADLFKMFINRSLDPGDMFSMFVFGAGTAVILALLWLWCFVSTAPIIVYIYEKTFGRSAGGLSLVNAMNPHIFRNMTKEQSAAAKEKLAAHPDPATHNPRVFDLDIAKCLLQISSLMYERGAPNKTDGSIQTIQKCMQDRPSTFTPYPMKLWSGPNEDDINTPGLLFEKLVGPQNAQNLRDALVSKEKQGRDPIDKWASKYGLCFEPVSELATVAEAYCSIFWDPRSTWLVVAFKGTDPRSFEEWSTDFTARFDDAKKDISGFKFVHRGFKQRMFPDHIPEEHRKPWHTIRAAVKIVSTELMKNRPDGSVCNVWFTGHSLGTALATLAYSKALISNDLGDKAIIRDAYLFATPITTDVTSKNAFNAAMYADRNIPRTLWRVTNRNDFVATGLPALGDSGKYDLGPENLFGFAHLGIEVFMKTGPQPCEVEGHKVKGFGDFNIQIASKFTPTEIIAQRKAAEGKGLTVMKLYTYLQDIPIVGRLAAHAATNYYDQLDQITIKAAIDRE